MAGEAAEVVQDTTDFSHMSAEELSSIMAGEGAAPKKEAPTLEPAPEPEPIKVETPEPVKEPEPSKGPTLEEIQAELEKARKQVQDKETFIQRQALEIGQLRKSVAPPQPVEIPNILDDAPGAVNAILTQRENALTQKRFENLSMVSQIVPDVIKHMDTIANLALADGYTEHDVALFKQDPYLYSTPAVLIGYARRAQQIHEVEELKAQLAEKEKEIATAKSKSEEILKKVEKAAKETPGLTAAGGSPNTRHDLSDKQFSNMTDSELAQWLKENNR